MKKNLRYRGFAVMFMQWTTYAQGNIPALQLWTHDAPLARISVNIGELPEGEMAVNNQFGDELAFLVDNGFAVDTGKRMRSGFVEYPIVKLLPR